MKVLIFGGSGLVGSKFINLYSKNFEISAPDTSSADILNKDQVTKVTQEFNPDVVINFAAYTQVEQAESQKDNKNGICYLINAVGAKNIAEVAKEFDKKLIHISTDYVFDGTKSDSPYTEQDQPNPINWYGQTKYFGEQFILESGCNFVIVRISMPFSASYQIKKDIARFFLDQLRQGNQIKAIEDQKITPTLVDDIAAALKIMIEEDAKGLYHISSTDSVSPLEFAKIIAEIFKLNYSLINSISFDEYNKDKMAKMLKFSWLNPTKFEEQFRKGILHTVEEEIKLFKSQIDSRESLS